MHNYHVALYQYNGPVLKYNRTYYIKELPQWNQLIYGSNYIYYVFEYILKKIMEIFSHSVELSIKCTVVCIFTLDEVFSKILKKPSIVQKWMIPLVNGLLVFFEMKQNSRILHFPAPPLLDIFHKKFMN